MSYEASFTALKELIQEQPSFHEALSLLKKGREIRILFDGQHECALFYQQSVAQLEYRPAQTPDIEFEIYPEALRMLKGKSPMNMAQLGIAIVKQVLAGSVKIHVLTGVLSVLSGGYFKIITSAGPEFMGYLAQHGLKNISKIQSLIASLKK